MSSSDKINLFTEDDNEVIIVLLITPRQEGLDFLQQLILSSPQFYNKIHPSVNFLQHWGLIHVEIKLVLYSFLPGLCTHNMWSYPHHDLWCKLIVFIGSTANSLHSRNIKDNNSNPHASCTGMDGLFSSQKQPKISYPLQ